jgi:hypothetical protein
MKNKVGAFKKDVDVFYGANVFSAAPAPTDIAHCCW